MYNISRLRVKDLHSATYIYVVRCLRVKVKIFRHILRNQGVILHTTERYGWLQRPEPQEQREVSTRIPPPPPPPLRSHHREAGILSDAITCYYRADTVISPDKCRDSSVWVKGFQKFSVREASGRREALRGIRYISMS